MQELIRKLLTEMGEDPAREGLRDTPKRVEKAYKFLTSGYDADIDQVLNNALFAVDYSEMVIVKDIDFYSLCEHHLLRLGRRHGHTQLRVAVEGAHNTSHGYIGGSISQQHFSFHDPFVFLLHSNVDRLVAIYGEERRKGLSGVQHGKRGEISRRRNDAAADVCGDTQSLDSTTPALCASGRSVTPRPRSASHSRGR